jgi:hypothetical protein
VSCFTSDSAALPYHAVSALNLELAARMHQPSFDPQRDIRTDYVLIATGVGAALLALIYLLVV